MTASLARCINKPILISSPVLFGNDEPRCCRLVGIESSGVWIDGENLPLAAQRPAHWSAAWLFVPFAQIAFLSVGFTKEPNPTLAQQRNATKKVARQTVSDTGTKPPSRHRGKSAR